MKDHTAFYVYWKGQRIRIPLQELQFVEIREDACVLHLTDSHVITDDPPEKIWSYLPENSFLSIRRKFMINLHFISGICDDYIHLGKTVIPQRTRQKCMINAYWLQRTGCAIAAADHK
jgi:DNA-binding LytR/AlgR family response regulator